MKVFRVFPYDANAAPNEPGGVSYMPPQGAGRIDNPQFYDAFYVSDAAAGACAEAFNYGAYRQYWSQAMLRGLPGLPDSRPALASFDLRDRPICDLDEPRELIAQSLRPSSVVTRDYALSQVWALRLFEARRWSGVKWWSYHDPRWGSIGFWDETVIRSHAVEELTLQHPAIAEAAKVLQIQII